MIVYHGTSKRLGYPIMTQGFRLYKDNMMNGRVSGYGVYVATKLISTAHWEDGMIIRAKLKPGLRILWNDPDYDRKVIRHLKKEFGKDIVKLGTRFHQAIPRNKQLTKRELIALVNYIFTKRVTVKIWNGKKTSPLWDTLSYLSEHVRRHQYDAIGDRSMNCWDSDEVMVFNPSNVVPLEVFSSEVIWGPDIFDPKEVRLIGPLTMGQLKEISDKAQRELDSWEKKWESDGEKEEEKHS